ncbi:ADP-ribosylglycohydrolase family protein [Anaerotignum propionicum]|uniref:ADP-ribosylglycohydrolase family protein n=1 Tax=Anaerotignum propionicum TaxID=28446 RepID=UPI0021091C27|nr:ADP-ribosylglycohydrolase family protein [Anaerotignum propionicum]MCQ4936375.1 ADP-ribosylglycohydrolase family protein [Anaerotignum propionicum]
MKNEVLDGIIGLCVADALGVPVEFNSRERLKANPVTDMRAYGTHNQPSGTWSDDTSMALCLLDSLSDGLDYKDVMDNFKSWLTEGKYTPHGEVFDVGIATRQAISRYMTGVEPLLCGGVGERDNGNGSLMRILPLLFYIQSLHGTDFQEMDEAFNMIHNVSALTHAHKRSQIVCGIYLSVASMLIGNMDLCIAVELGIYKAVQYYKGKPEYETEISYYHRLSEKNFREINETEIRSSGYVVDTLEAAIWCLVNSKTYKDCVLIAVNLGDDTDTVAAIAGGLAGLYYGSENIPVEWTSKIVRKDYIEDLSERLHRSLTKRSIDKLLAFIPYFENLNEKNSCSWGGGEKLGENHFSMPYPIYEQTLEDFIQAVYSSNLICYNYLEVIEKNGLHGTEEMNTAIEQSDFELTLAILTGYIRQERFCDGLWESAIEDKTFLKILRRLEQLMLVGN